MDEYLKKALSSGFSKAVFLSDLTIECKPELRAFCDSGQCTKHGNNWVCPPGCGTLDECREKARAFHMGILLQSVTELNPPVKPEKYAKLNHEHNSRFKEFIEYVRHETPKVLPLTSGGCILCEECSYPEPCIKPGLKMESLSAFGIDVRNLCELAGLPFAFRPDIVYFTALLLVKS